MVKDAIAKAAHQARAPRSKRRRARPPCQFLFDLGGLRDLLGREGRLMTGAAYVGIIALVLIIGMLFIGITDE